MEYKIFETNTTLNNGKIEPVIPDSRVLVQVELIIYYSSDMSKAVVITRSNDINLLNTIAEIAKQDYNIYEVDLQYCKDNYAQYDWDTIINNITTEETL